MTYEPDSYMSQPDNKLVREEHIKYVKDDNGKITMHTVVIHFYGDGDYQDSQSTTPLG